MLLEGFDDIEDIKKKYEISDKEMEGVEILCACYFQGCYDGESAVLFKKDGEFHLVDAGHCSCHGLEGMWESTIYCEEALKDHLKDAADYEESLKWIYKFCKDYFKWE